MQRCEHAGMEVHSPGVASAQTFFHFGFPGRAEQETKAGDEHPLSCC